MKLLPNTQVVRNELRAILWLEHGTVVYHSLAAKNFVGDFELLKSCAEANIVEVNGYEDLDYKTAIAEYNRLVR